MGILIKKKYYLWYRSGIGSPLYASVGLHFFKKKKTSESANGTSMNFIDFPVHLINFLAKILEK
jgi:hypothetical protein